MTDTPDVAVPKGLADLPLSVRRRLAVAWERELDDGLTRRHLTDATYEQRNLAVQFARVLRMRKRER